jgi:PAS domain S-box-containing protein
MKENRYQSIIRMAPVGYALHEIITDKKGKPVDYSFVDVNDAFENLTGKKASDIIGKKASEYFPEILNSPIQWIDFFGDIALNGGSASFEIFSKGMNRLFRVQVFSEEKGFFVTFFTDAAATSEDKSNTIQSQISETGSEEKILNLLNFAPDAFFHTDEQGNILFTNEKAIQLLGYSREELLSLKVYQLFPESELKRKPLRYDLADRGDTVIATRKMKRKDGCMTDIEMSSRRIPDGTYETFVRDISERRLSEEKLNQSEAKFRRLVEFSPDIVYSFSTRMGRSYHSDQVINVLGYTPAQLAAEPTLWYNRIHPDDKPAVDNALKGAESGNPIDVEYRIETAAGDWKWLHDRSIHSYRIDDEVITEGLAMDITERKLNEVKIRENEEKFRLLSENVSDVIWIMDIYGKYHFISRSVEKMRGIPIDEAMQESFDDTLTPDSAKAAHNLLVFYSEKILKGEMPEPQTLVLEQKCKDGSTVWTEILVSGIYDKEGKFQYFLGVTRDLTEKNKIKAVQEALLESENRFYKLLENVSSVAVQGYYNDGTVHYWNKASELLYGHSASEAIGKNLIDLIIPEHLKDEVRSAIRLMAETGEVPPPSELELQHRDGKLIQVLSTHAVVRKNGSPVELFCLDVDVSVLKKSQAELTLAHSRNRALLDAMPDLMFLFDSSCKIIDYHAADEGKDLFLKPEVFLNKDVDDVLPDFLAELTKKNVQTVLSTGQSCYSEYSMEKDSKTEHFEARYVACGKNEVLAIVRNITEQKNFHVKLQENECHLRQLQQLFRNIADNMPDMLWAKDLEGKYIFANKAICDKLLNAVDTSEPIGKDDIYFALRERRSHPDRDDWHTFGELCKDSDVVVMESGKTEQFDEYGHVKGKFLYLDVVKTPLFDETGKLIGTVGAARDATDRKEAELRQQIQYNIAKDIIRTENLEQLLETVRSELNQLFNTTNFFFALYNSDTDMLRRVIFKDEKDMFKEWKADKTLSGWVVKNRKALLLNQKNLEKFAVSNHLDLIGTVAKCWLGVPVIAGEKPMGVIVTQSYHDPNAYDHSSQVLLEMIAHEIGIFLERKLMIEDIITAKQKAEESDRLKSAFLANMSHEIRTPMNGILGFLELLKEMDFTESERNLFIEAINESGNRLMNTINDIIEMSKIEAGQVEVHLSEVEIEKEMLKQYNDFEPLVKKKGIDFLQKARLKGDESFVKTDQTKLDVIFKSLIRNAITFTNEGFIEIGNSLQDGQIVFYVKDTGAGIPEHRKEAIFKRFVQADLSINRPNEGAGLGLSIAKAYVEMMGGSIWVESTEGKGSTFFFSLPYTAVKEAAPVARKLFSDIESLPQGYKILIAEDDEISFKYLECIFNRKDLVLIHATNGEDAVKAVKEHPDISIILMDIRMPVMNGIEATKRIREFNHEVPIIAQTAYALDGDRENALSSGCNEYISKPINRNKLLGMIHQFC